MEYILLESYIVYGFLFLFFMFFIGFCIMGSAWLNSERKHDATKASLKKERSNYNHLLVMYQRDTFRLPEVDKDV